MQKGNELALAVRAVVEAGNYLKKRQDIRVDSSDGKDLKLSSDRESERMILDILAPSGLPVLSEESGRIGALDGLCWVVDPLDGSMNYYRGMDDLCCVSVALWDGKTPLLGAVNRFMCDELFAGESGYGATRNGQLVHPSGVHGTAQAVLATGFPVKRNYDTESIAAFVRRVQCFKKVRMLGAAALMGSYVACGRVDAYMEDGIMLWDVMGAAAIVQAAGGVVEIEVKREEQCICRLFANKALAEDFHGQSL